MDGSPTGSDGPRARGAGEDAAQATTIELLRSVLADGVRLISADLRLAAAESAASGRRVGMAAGLGVAALVLGGVALNVLAAAAVCGVMAAGYPAWIAALVVFGAVLALSVIAAAFALHLAKTADPVPHKAVDRMRRDLAAIMEAAGHAAR
jgi:hypothetical protein